MEKVAERRIKLYQPYAIMLAVYLAFIIFAFATEHPTEIFRGFYRIATSRSVLLTDYIAVGGLSAALLNSAVAGSTSVLMLMLSGVKPNGATIMALWLTTGFAFFGKNVFNMIPLTFGVWLHSKAVKKPYNSIASLLVATVSPIVSEISFMGVFYRPLEIIAGIIFGAGIGFIFPTVSAATMKVHGGYDLYNMGFAGGLVATVVATALRNIGATIEAKEILSEGNNIILALGLYLISAALFCCGIFFGNAKQNFKNQLKILKSPGVLSSDFYTEHGNSVYINMALLCAFATTLPLVLGAQLNGPIIAGILTVAGFGSFGKHLKNVLPILIGAIISINVNHWDLTSTTNVISVLFSTALAPIAGHYGWKWGVAAGFLHVNLAMHTAYLGGGMNLYNNGFAAGFVALFLLPLIKEIRREDVT